MATDIKHPPISRSGFAKVSHFLQKHGALTALILIVIAASIRYDSFLTQMNILNVLRQNSMLGIVAIGMTLVILTGGIDLSVGSLLALGGIVSAYFSQYGLVAALLVPLVITGALGFVNGYFITKGKIDPFIVTLATMIGIRGLVYAVTNQHSLTVDSSIHEIYKFFGRGSFFGVPTPIWIFVLLAAVAAWMLKQTGFGRHIYSVGGNEEASKLMGLKVDRIKIWVYVINGALSGLAGVVLASRLGGVAQAVAGNTWELDAIAAVVIGGTILTGGKGNISGTFYGVMLLGVILNIINLEGDINSWWQPVIRGVFLIVIVILQSRLLTRKNSRRLST
ncbi:MAG TPA: ABC transporter permease [Bacillales bacterium]|nr:ABC transporter permease [Bacillales bacterium]